MRSPSLPLLTIFGVEVRLHLYMVVTLGLLLMYTALSNQTFSRGMALWLLLLAAVAVRELGRALAAAALGLDLRRLVLLPSGALPTYAQEPHMTPRKERVLALAGPLSNFLAALTMALLIFCVTSRFNLFERHLVEPGHLLRAAVWLQVLVGALHLLPASPLDAGTFLRQQFVRVRGHARGNRAAAGLGQAIGWALVLIGTFTQEMLVVILGGCALLTAQTESNASMAQDAARSLTMGDVMLSEWTSLSASETLEDALRRSTHSLQEVFPVVRGPLVVGSVTRQKLMFALRSEGNGYVQSVMSRGVRPALASDPLVQTLQQASARGENATTIIPVMNDSGVIGMVTPQNLTHAMVSLGRTRRLLDRTQNGNRRTGNND